ncbi:MAG TPA: aminoacyl-histidine dipeptidase [Candidatus Polarisedimenticolaceae bacterium]|nr:aminoacyl-histidine dipeptidase [Candidatus Polarisedimenticolaceae bacterium]
MAAGTRPDRSINVGVRRLEPTGLWNHFADLNAVPRASKKEQRVIRFMRAFGERLALETVVDEVGNVVIRKPASPGMEDRLPIVMQSHLDMVHQKNADTDFDFDTEGIEMVVEGDWVRAAGTTLGADNGIGVATIMTVLAEDAIAHPRLEALFTIDEETGMTGAKGLKGGLLTGRILLNLDTEADDELTIGCAGGVDVTATGRYDPESTPAGQVGLELVVRGLQGGHSGMEIHVGFANANKLMNRLLAGVVRRFGARLSSIDGGGLRNAIPRESFAIVTVSRERRDELAAWVAAEAETIRVEYRTTDPAADVRCTPIDAPRQVVPTELTRLLLGAIDGVHSGIHRMSPEVGGLVQTSNNLARVRVADGEFTLGCLTRSSVDSERDALARSIAAVLELTGADLSTSGSYPGWQPAPESAIVKLMSSIYKEMFDAPAEVSACHAGLECGIIGTNYPGLEMISFGPTILGAHSPDERVKISSVQKYWRFLLETLKRIPAGD